jgi:hypothetical protein
LAGLLKGLALLINTESPIQERKEIIDKKTAERLKSLGYLQYIEKAVYFFFGPGLISIRQVPLSSG